MWSWCILIWGVFGVFQAQLIAQSMGQAFQVAYMEFLKANGIDDPGLMKEMDYQEVLNQQEIYGEELGLFANKDTQKEVGNLLLIIALFIMGKFIVLLETFVICLTQLLS